MSVGQWTFHEFGTQTELVLQVRQHWLKVPGVIGLAAARVLKVIWLSRHIGTNTAVEMPYPPYLH